MHTQHGIRRWVLSALVALVVALAALGSGYGASAVEDDGGYPIDGYIDEEHFKEMCELMDGVFSKDKYGDTSCHYADGSRTHCDAYGQDCWRIPARLQRPGVEQTYDETAPALLEEDGAGGVPTGDQAPSGPPTRPHTEPLAPVVDTTTSLDAQPVQEQASVQDPGAATAPVEDQP